MKKVTLLGDSIRLLGYGERVAQRLSSCCEVFQPKENCRYAKHTLRGLYDWRKDMAGSTVVHWNNGLWDTCDLYGDGPFTDEGEYVKNMLRIAEQLQSCYGQVIFATTTPVTEKNQHNNNITIARYNTILVPLLKERGIWINDLYSAVAADLDRYICQDTIHLSEEGSELCAQLTEGIIRRALEEAQEASGDEAFGGVGAPV